MSDLEDFLEKHVKGYVFADLESMKKTEPRADGNGACVYPMIATTCAAIELLGNLLNDSKDFEDEGAGRQFFREYWQGYVYRTDPQRQYADVLYRLMRHGLAHTFVTWGPILAYKESNDIHLTEEGTKIYVSASKFADDFMESYKQAHPNLLASASAARKIEAMVAQAKKNEVPDHSVRKHPLPPAPNPPPPGTPSMLSSLFARNFKPSGG